MNSEQIIERCARLIETTRIYSSSPKAIYDISQEARDEQAKLIRAEKAKLVNSTSHDKSTVFFALLEFILTIDDAKPFIIMWANKDFDAIRKEWPNAPKVIFSEIDDE